MDSDKEHVRLLIILKSVIIRHRDANSRSVATAVDVPNLHWLKVQNLMSMKGHKWLLRTCLSDSSSSLWRQSHPDGAQLSVSLVLLEPSVFHGLCSRGRKRKWPAAGQHHSEIHCQVWGARGSMGSHFDGPLIQKFDFLSPATLICNSLCLSRLPYELLI